MRSEEQTQPRRQHKLRSILPYLCTSKSFRAQCTRRYTRFASYGMNKEGRRSECIQGEHNTRLLSLPPSLHALPNHSILSSLTNTHGEWVVQWIGRRQDEIFRTSDKGHELFRTSRRLGYSSSQHDNHVASAQNLTVHSSRRLSSRLIFKARGGISTHFSRKLHSTHFNVVSILAFV
jgi:hypothetical protein